MKKKILLLGSKGNLATKIINFYKNNQSVFNNNLDELDFLNNSNNLNEYKIDINPKDIYKNILNLINEKKN